MSLQASRRCTQGSACTVCSLCSLLFARQLGPAASRRLSQQGRQPAPICGVSTFNRQLGIGDSATNPAVFSLRLSLPAADSRSLAPARGQRQRPRAAVPMAKATSAEANASETDHGVAQMSADPQQQPVTDAYEQQLSSKIDHVRALFSDFQLPPLEVFRSDPEHYRLRYVTADMIALLCLAKISTGPPFSMPADACPALLIPQGRVPGVA